MKVFGKEPEKVHNIELTQSEVDIIKVLLAECEKNGPSHELYLGFKGIATNKYRVQNSDRVPAIKMVLV